MQHGVVSRDQLLERGLSRHAIDHRLKIGRLHRIFPSVYAVGHPDLTRYGTWMAAVLACGPDAALSFMSAAALYALFEWRGAISISIHKERDLRPKGITVHRVDLPPTDVAVHNRIPVTSPARTLVDLATTFPTRRLERAVNQADKLNLIDPESLRLELDRRPGRRGVPALKELLDRHTFVLTESDLEQRFLRIARRAGLPKPETGVRLNGYLVDFFWPDLGLVVETDGLTYHRTPLEQARDRRRDQAHAAAGLTTLRFTHRQIVDESNEVQRTLGAVATRLARAAA